MKKYISINTILPILCFSSFSAFATIPTVSPGETVSATYMNSITSAVNTLDNTTIPNISTEIGSTSIPTGYGNDLTSAVNTIVNGSSTSPFTNTGLKAAANHIYYLSPDNLASQDLCGFLNTLNTNLTSGEAVTIVLAPANASSLTNVYSCGASATMPANVALIGTGTTTNPNTGWNLGSKTLTLKDNDLIKGVSIFAEGTSAAANTAALQISLGSHVTLKDDLIIESASGSADAISINGGSGSSTTLSIFDSYIYKDTSGSSCAINFYNSPGTININNSQIGYEGNTNGIKTTADLTVNADASYIGSINTSTAGTTLNFHNSTAGDISGSTSMTIKSYDSTLGSVPDTVSTLSLFAHTGIRSTNGGLMPQNSKCFSSYNTNVSSYSLLTGCGYN